MPDDDPTDETPPRPPVLPTSAKGAREAADYYRARERFHAAMLYEVRRKVAWYDRLAARMERGEISIALTPPPKTNHNRTDMPDLVPVIRYRRGRPSASDHAFVVWLEARKKGPNNLAAWAEEHDLTRERVKGWVAKGSASRRIPRTWADIIERESVDPKTKKPAVPATLATWPQGISE